jgi:hypothetical protein
MSLEKYMATTAARVKVTLPVAWGSERKLAYLAVEMDLPSAHPEPDSVKFALNQLIDQIQEVATRRAPVPTPTRLPQPFCKYCRENGFPNVEIKFQGKDESGRWKPPLNPDGTPHIHKEKAK